MINYVKQLTDKGLIQPPEYMADGMHYLTIMGSYAYGVSQSTSDFDLYGMAIPPLESIFPHMVKGGDVIGFGRLKQPNNWTKPQNYQKAHVQGEDREYDFSIYGIVDYFQLVLENNPNMLDSLFTPDRCVVFCAEVGRMVRERRKDFLHRGCFHTFKGMAINNLKSFDSNPIGKKKAAKEQFGYDPKTGYQVVRPLLEAEQLLKTGDMDLEANAELLKHVKAGGWTRQQVEKFYADKIAELEGLYEKTTLPWGPQEGPQDKVKSLLFDCLEQQYGSLEKAGIYR